VHEITSRIAHISDDVWNSPLAGGAVWLAGVGAILSFLWSPPPPGVAAVVLGALVAAMMLREMKSTQKLFVVVAVFALAYIEMGGINRERATQDGARLTSEKVLQDNFAKVLDQNQREFENTKIHMEMAITQAQSILNNISGGDNYLVVKAKMLPKPIDSVEMTLYAYNEGDIQLPNARLAASPPGVIAGQPGYASLCIWPPLSSQVIPAHDNFGTGCRADARKYHIELTASNGPADEMLTMEKVGPHKFRQYVVINKNGVEVYNRTINVPE
jgi:hypothetical protein